MQSLCSFHPIWPYFTEAADVRGCLMRIIAIGALALLAYTPTAFAQDGQKKYKQSCEEFCSKYCQTAPHRNYCMGECPNKCRMKRGGK